MFYAYKIHKLHCSACASSIESALLNLPEVTGAIIDIQSKKMRIEASKSLELDAINAIIASVEAQTYATVEDASTQNTANDEPEDEQHGPSIRAMVISGILLAIGLIYQAVYGEHGQSSFVHWIVQIFCFFVPYIVCGRTVLLDGWKSLLRKDFFNEFTLMAGATIAAIAIGHMSEAVGVMLFYCIGEHLQEKAAGKSRHSIKSLLATKPSIAHVCDKDGQQTHDLRPEEVLVGDYVVVRAGEKIPLDGEVVDGTSHVDTAPLTGEPMPIVAEKGSTVFAGCINKDSSLIIRVTTRFSDTSVARILEMVENATARKAPLERFITRFARYYTPAVVVIATLLAILPPLFGMGTFSEWLYRALVLLVISCPCALLISIPLGYFGGIGAASQKGILVKGAYVLDALQWVKVASFDKTGTLTYGTFSITQKLPADDVTEKELLTAAGLAECRSNHPLAKAIVNDVVTNLGHAPRFLNLQTQEIAGKGILAHTDRDVILVGTHSFMEEQKIQGLPAESVLVSVAKAGESLVFVAKNGNYLGAILCADTLRPNAHKALENLRKQGVQKLVMLTGDSEGGANMVAEKLPLDMVKSRLLPQDKAQILAELGPSREVLFMGDGINDAPALASAGIGIAMGGLGSEVAVETSDAVVLDDNLEKVAELLRIAAATRAIVWQNVVLALSIKLVFVGLGVLGLSGLWEAVFADVGVALLAVLNASRAVKA